MKKTKFTESQIVNIMKEAEAGVSLEGLSRQHGFSKATFYPSKYEYLFHHISGNANGCISQDAELYSSQLSKCQFSAAKGPAESPSFLYSS